MKYLEFGILTAVLTIGMSQPAYAIVQAVQFLVAAGPIGWVALGIGAYFGLKYLSKMNKQGRQANREMLVNKQSNSDPIPVVYGQRRIGGVRVYVTTNNGNDSGKGDKEVLNIARSVLRGLWILPK